MTLRKFSDLLAEVSWHSGNLDFKDVPGGKPQSKYRWIEKSRVDDMAIKETINGFLYCMSHKPGTANHIVSMVIDSKAGLEDGYYKVAMFLKLGTENSYEGTNILNSRVAYISELVNVNPEYRGAGLARSMYEWVILRRGVLLRSDDVQWEGAKKLWIELAHNPKITMYAWVKRKFERKGKLVQVIGHAGGLEVDGDDEDLVYTWANMPLLDKHAMTPSQRHKMETVAFTHLYAVRKGG